MRKRILRKRRVDPQFWVSIPGNVWVPPELVVDGGFSGNGPTGSTTTPSGNSNSGGYLVTGGQARITNNTAAKCYVWTDIPTIAGRTYDAAVTVVAGTSGASAEWYIEQADASVIAGGTGAGAKSHSAFVATGAFIRFSFSPGTATSGHTMFYDDMSVKLNAAAEAALVFSHAKSLGYKGIRTDFEGQWVFYGDSSGRYWTDPDAVVAGAIANGLELCFCEVSSPAWAAATPNTYPTTQLSAFATCMQDAAARYQGSVKYWEVRNEQNLALFSATTAGGGSIASCASAYMTYATSVVAGIRAGNPRAKIISTGLSAAPNTLLGTYLKASDYLTEMYASGAKGMFDYIGFHPYASPLQPDDPASYNGWQIMEKDIQAVKGGAGEGSKPIFATEFGYCTGGTSAGMQQTEALSGAGIITAMHRLKYLGNVPMIAYYSDIDRHASQFSSTSNEDYFGAYLATLAEKSAITNAIRYAQRVL